MMFGWANKTILAVIFVGLLMWFMLASEKSNAGTYLGLGHTVANSSVTSPELGYRFGKYGIAIEATGEGMTDKGPQAVNPILTAYRLIDPEWCYKSLCFRSAIGAAYTPKQRLVGPTNYRLELIAGVGSSAELYVKHYSSAGSFENNTGVDVVGVRFLF